MHLLHAIVLAGGSGSRLAALTGDTPKQFCAFGGRLTLLQETLARLGPLAPPDRTAVVVREQHLALARGQVQDAVTLLAQPLDRGTAMGILWPLVRVLRRDPEATVIVTPSDHGVREPEAYRRGLAAAAEAAEGAAAVLLGAEATGPRTDYGWILPGDEGGFVSRVEAFVEKPRLPEAMALVARGALFSTMVVVARARALLALFERTRPGLAALLLPLASLPEAACGLHLRRAFALMPACDFSREILAAAGDLAVVRLPRAVGWTDLGTPERLLEWLGAGPPAPRAPGGAAKSVAAGA